MGDQSQKRGLRIFARHELDVYTLPTPTFIHLDYLSHILVSYPAFPLAFTVLFCVPFSSFVFRVIYFIPLASYVSLSSVCIPDSCVCIPMPLLLLFVHKLIKS
jgi:hypothetical protein